ncbi:MAG: DUF4293 domain-containing protein [Bacteroidales bacterium]|nr:DUF4293 domain-containing protein [Bacteroidales bacterium]MCR5245199.1 DUF4293 domain-containing protein [Bacteroidales bacterium]
MWQRIQTLYLVLALGLCVAALFLIDGTYFLILTAIAAVMTLIALATYKHRIFQMRTSVIAGLMLVGLQVWILVKYFLAGDKTAYNIAYVFPIVAAILVFLAARNILADEMLVQSASRLRSNKRK